MHRPSKHAALTEGSEQPATLYKYVSSERALTCLPEVGNGALRATQPSALNDPFECASTRAWAETDQAEGDEVFSRVLTSIAQNKPVTAVQVSAARSVFGSLYIRNLMAQQLSYRFGIVSFATDPFNPLLWSHYTVDGSGFVIGYDRQRLGLEASSPDHLRPVRYLPRPPLSLGHKIWGDKLNILKLLAVKSDYWSYEDEWRLIAELAQTVGTGGSDRHGQPINLLPIRNTIVKEVYFTERTPASSVEAITTRLADEHNRYGTKRLTKLVIDERKYGYVPEQEKRTKGS